MVEFRIHPHNVPLSELIHFGENHESLWVRHLAETLDDILARIPECKDIGDWAEPLETLNDYKNELKDRETQLADAHEEIDELTERVNALRYDADRNVQQRTIEGLKSRILELEKEATYQSKLKEELLCRNRIQEAELKDLRDKFEFWTLMSS